ncbi:MAG: phosphoesterase [Candidatus Woesearchaeota archaeon]|nr:MAG: phosphoesterase [Candidatus Woesearchaeota archaeon]
MKLSKNIAAENLFLIIGDALIISDIHLGYEESLHKQGFFIPKGNVSELTHIINNTIVKKSIKKIILNGDLVHSFGKLSLKERYVVKEFITDLKKKVSKIIIIKGNHDNVLEYILPEEKIVKEHIIGDVLITHGDLINSNANKKEIRTIIIGHEHPSITISLGYRTEKYKCFLKGFYKKKELIVMPSCNMLIEGTDILREKLLSPYLENIDSFNVYIIGDKIYDFGKISALKDKMSNS